jgi:hypothetical protein
VVATPGRRSFIGKDCVLTVITSYHKLSKMGKEKILSWKLRIASVGMGSLTAGIIKNTMVI